jgi:hypothetical protein
MLSFKEKTKTLIIPRDFNGELIDLPEDIEEVWYRLNDTKLLNKLPANIKKLHFGSKFNQPLENIPNVIELGFGFNFNQPLLKT